MTQVVKQIEKLTKSDTINVHEFACKKYDFYLKSSVQGIPGIQIFWFLAIITKWEDYEMFETFFITESLNWLQRI